MTYLVFAIVGALVGALAFLAGRAHGRSIERDRAVTLLKQAFDARSSGSVRWVLNAVLSGRDRLDPDFFGKDGADG